MWETVNVKRADKCQSFISSIVAIVTKPGKIKCYLLSEVLPDVIQRLVMFPAGPLGPVAVQYLSHTQIFGGHWGGRQLEPTLQTHNVNEPDFQFGYLCSLCSVTFNGNLVRRGSYR